MKIDRRTAIKTAAVGVGSLAITPEFLRAADGKKLFGEGFANLETLTTGEWWKRPGNNGKPAPRGRKGAPPSMNVPRDQVVAFAMYTHQGGVLKLSAQLFPLKPGEKREVRLELQLPGEKWSVAAKAEVHYPGWDAHFRIENWDNTNDVKYRVCHGEKAKFEGLIRRDPVDRDEIVVANLSCNSSRTTGPRDEIVKNLRQINPDLLFFGGDQHYRHTEHTTGWIEFGLQYCDVIRDRPTVCIPDDHDVGHGRRRDHPGCKPSGDRE